MTVRTVKVTDAHQATYKDILGFIDRAEKRGLDRRMVLAVASNIVGKLVALQDQTKTTTQNVMAEVAANIEKGNAEMLKELMSAGGTPN